MEPQYLSSKDVKAFPASWRSAESGDPESSLTTETSLRRLAYARFSHRSTAYIDPSSHEFVIVVDGYVFVVSPDTGESDPRKAAIGKIIEQFPDKDFPDISDIYAGITVAAMGMTVGDTQYNENGLFEQLRSSNSTNNALDGVPAGSETSSFYGLQLSDTEPKTLSARLHILHRDKLEDETYGDWYIPEEAKFVTDTNQVQNRGGDVSIGTRLDTKEVYATPSGKMTSEPTEPPYSRLDSDGLKVASSQDPGKVFSIDVYADKISLSAPTGGGAGKSEASLTKSDESLTLSDDAEIDVFSPTISISAGEGYLIGMSKGGPIQISSEGIPIKISASDESIELQASSVDVDALLEAKLNATVDGQLEVRQKGVFGNPEADGTDAYALTSVFMNGAEFQAIEVSAQDDIYNALRYLLAPLHAHEGRFYRTFVLVDSYVVNGVLGMKDGLEGPSGLPPTSTKPYYCQLWDLSFFYRDNGDNEFNDSDYIYVSGRLEGELFKNKDSAADDSYDIYSLVDSNGYPFDATLNVKCSLGDTWGALLGNQVRTSTIPSSTINGWFNG